MTEKPPKDGASDVLIVGSGIIGLSIAYHMKLNNPDEEITVVEKESVSGQGDTAKSAGAVRNVFASEVNRLLANTSLDFYSHVQNDLGYNLDLALVGYLWLLTEEAFDNLADVLRSLQLEGIEFRVWNVDELSEIIRGARLTMPPGDNEAEVAGLKNVSKGLQGIKCGTASPDLIAGFYEHEFKKMGGQIKYNTRVESIILEPKQKIEVPGEPFIWQEKKIVGVRTRSGDLRANTTILASGCWATEILNTVGIDSHFRTKKRQLFVFGGPKIRELLHTKGFNRYDIMPFTILPRGGVFMRPTPAEDSFWVGAADDLGRPFRFEENPKTETEYYTLNIYPILSKYFSQYVDLRPTNAWAGLYDINTLDANPWIIRDNGIILATGLSGSGVMKADAVGRIVAALYDNKEYANLYGGRKIKVNRLGLHERDVGVESFVL